MPVVEKAPGLPVQRIARPGAPPPTWAPPETDLVGAVIERVRSSPYVSALTYNSAGNFNAVAGAFNPKWTMPTYAVLIRQAGGPPGIDGTSIERLRLDVLCYGPGTTYPLQQRNADALYRAVKAALCPPGSMGYRRDFIASNGCAVWDVIQEGRPIVGVEPNTDWGRVISSFIFMYGTIAE